MTVSEWKEDFKSFINELQIPRDDYKGIMAYIDEGAELLKEQEPVKPAPGMLCGQCGCRIYRDANYCYNCGRRVAWDD